MQLSIHPEIFARFPGIKVAVAVARGVDNRSDSPGVTERWRAAWAGAAAAAVYGNAQSHPRVRPWRERFRAMGVSGKDFPSSIEAMIRRALKGGEPFQISPLVDFYNSVSLTHTVPAGGFDLAHVAGPIELRLTRTGDRYLALDADEPVAVPPGEAAYVTGSTVLTRHLVWRQAKEGLIRPETRDVMLLSEVLGELEDGVAAAVLEDFRSGLARYFGATAQTWILDAEHPHT